MVAIPFPGTSRPGARPSEGQGRLVNAYAIKEGDVIKHRRVPGLALHKAMANVSTARGIFYDGVNLLVAADNTLIKIDPTGTATPLLNTLDGAGPVSFARNANPASPDVVVVSSAGAYTVGSTQIVNYPDPDVGQPNSVASLDGYLLFTTAAGFIIATGLNTTAINSLSNAKAESNPDGLLRGLVAGQLFYAFGSQSIEVFQNVGSSPFPLARVAVIPVGLMSAFAATGAQDGWEGTPIFVATDGTVRRLNGYQPEVISESDQVRDILRAQRNGWELRASVYVDGDMAVWSLTAIDASDVNNGFTWEFNLSTGAWHERKSHLMGRWRATFSCQAFNRWLILDTLTANVLEIDGTRALELDEALPWELWSAPVKAFPAATQCRRADFDFVVGVGSEMGLDPIQTDPVVEISWSDDGGSSFGTPIKRALGRQGDTRRNVTVLNCGQSSQVGRVWRLRVFDPVYVTLMGGNMETKARIF